jgi:hypothetical protein
MAPLPLGRLSIPVSSATSYDVLRVRWNHLMLVSTQKIAVGVQEVMDGQKDACLLLQNDLLDKARELVSLANQGSFVTIQELDYLAKVKDFDFRQKALERNGIISSLPSFGCVKCPDLEEHVCML